MADKIIKYRGEFDASQILTSLKKIRDEASKNNVDSKLLGNFDKDLERLEKLTTQYLAQLKKGFSTNADVKSFAKTLNDLEKIYSVINVRAEQFGNVASFSTETEEVKRYTKELKTLTESQKNLTTSAHKYIQDQGEKLKLNKTEIASLQKLANEAEAYKDKLNEIASAKKAAAQQKIGKLAIDTSFGQNKYQEITQAGNTDFNFAIASKKTPDKTRATAIKGSGDNARIDTIKAQSAAQAEYNRILRETMQNGQSAERAIEAFVEIMRHYRLELTNTDKIQEDFARDMESISQAAVDNKSSLTPKEKSTITRNQNAIARADSLETDMTGNEVTALQQATSNLLIITQQLASAIQDAGRKAENAARETSQGLEDNAEKGQALVHLGREDLDIKSDQIQKQNELNESFDRISYIIKQVLSLTSVWRNFRQQIINTYNDVKQLDKAFAEIAMVTDYSVEDMWAQYTSYAQMANRLGQTTQSVIQSSGLFYQQGLDTAEALSLTEETMKLATLAGLDFKDATSQMTAALRAFHMEMSEGSHITDVYAELAAHAAADVNGIAQAMSATASIANSAGMSFENTSAFLTQMIETTQEAPKNLGTALKTIIARFTELKENVAGTADSEFEDLDFNKVDKALKTVGVQLKDTTGQFRNLDEVFLELSSKWDSLDRNSQRYIATIAAGSRQQSRFIAMMENYDRTLELIETAQDSAGKSSEQFAKYQDTVEYKVNQLKNTWEELRISFANSDLFKSILDDLNVFLKNVKKLSKNKALFAGIGVAFTLSAKKIITSLIASLQNGIKKAQQTINATKLAIKSDNTEVKGLKNLLNEIIEQQNRINGTTVKVRTSTESTETTNVPTTTTSDSNNQNNQNSPESKSFLSKTKKDFEDSGKSLGDVIGLAFSSAFSSAVIVGLSENNPMEAMGKTLLGAVPLMVTQLTGLIGAYIGVSKAADEAAAAQARAAVSASLVSLGITAGIAVIAAATVAFIKYSQAQKEAEDTSVQLTKATERLEAAQEKVGETKDKITELTETKDNLKELIDRYQELEQQVIKTDEEQQEYNETVEKIRTQYPDLVSWYDEENNSLKLSTSLIEEKNKRLNDQIALQQKLLSFEQTQSVTASNEVAVLEATGQLDSLGIDLKTSDIKNGTFRKLTGGKVDKITLEGNTIDFDGVSVDAEKFDGLLKSFEGFEETTYNDLIGEQGEGFQNILNYLFSNGSINDLKDEWKDTAEQIKAELEEIRDAGLDNYDALYQIAKSNQDVQEAQGKDSDSEVQKVIKAAYSAAKADKIDNTTFEELGNGIDWGSGSSVSEMLDNWGLKDKELKTFGLSISDLKEASDKLTDAISEGSYGTENDFADVKGALGDNKIAKEILRLTKITDQKSYEEFFGEGGISDTETNEKIGRLIHDYIIQKILNNDDIKLSGDLQTRLEDFATQQEALSSAQYIEQYNNIKTALEGEVGTDTGIADKILTSLFPDATKIQEAYDGMVETFGKAFVSGKDKDTINVISGFYKNLAENVSDEDAAAITKSFTQLLEKSGIKEKDWAPYFQIKWDEVTNPADYEAWKKKQIENLRNAGYEISESLFDGMAAGAEAGGLLDITISSSVELDAYVDKLKEAQKIAYEQKDTFISAINAQIKDGKINLEQYLSLAESLQNIGEDVADYTSIDENGEITLNNSALSAIYDKQTSALIEQLHAAKEKTKAELDSLKNGESQLDLQIDAAEAVLTEISNEMTNTAAIQEGNNKLVDRIKLINAISDKKISIPELSADNTATLQTNLEGIKKTLENLRAEAGDPAIAARIAELEKTLAEYDEQEERLKNLSTAYLKDWEDSLKNTVEETKTAAEDAAKAEVDALKAVQEAQEGVIEAQKKLNEALHGTEFHKNKNDPLYNYTTNLERIQQLADEAKDKLEDLQDWDNANQAMADYINNVHKEAVTGAAESRVYEQAIANGQNSLNKSLQEQIEKINKERGTDIQASLGQLYTKVGDRYNVDYNALNQLAIPDDFKDRIEDEIATWNKDLDEIEKIQKQKLARQKEFNKLQKDALQNMVDLQKEMADALKEKYEQEIEDIENKYQAMEEADNEYVDALSEAIEKQRKLRNEENQWNDLANKERKLALMQRDTSGGNRAETRQLEQEVQNDRQELLDNAVDNIIDGLKEMYELQKESREAEIEYRKTLLDEGLLMQEAVAALSGINTAEELVEWFYNNTADLSKMSKEQIELEKLGWKDLFDAKVVYLETSQANFNKALEVNENEIATTVSETSETLTSEAERALGEVTNTVNENIKSAQDSLSSAIDTLTEKEEAYTEAIKANKDAQNAYNSALTSLNTILNEISQRKTVTTVASNIGKGISNGIKNTNTPATYTNPTVLNELEKTYSTNKTYSTLDLRDQWKQPKSFNQIYKDIKNDFTNDKNTYRIYSKKELENKGVTDFDIFERQLEDNNVDFTKTKGGGYKISKFAQGGLVNYTGPAWVDGTKSRPEAFLSADDTRRIGEAAKLLADLPFLDSNSWENNNITNTNVGDTIIDVNITIENVSSDYDVDQAVERVKQDIVDAAKYAGSNVILRKT